MKWILATVCALLWITPASAENDSSIPSSAPLSPWNQILATFQVTTSGETPIQTTVTQSPRFLRVSRHPHHRHWRRTYRERSITPDFVPLPRDRFMQVETNNALSFDQIWIARGMDELPNWSLAPRRIRTVTYAREDARP